MATLTRRALLQSAALAASGVVAPFAPDGRTAADKVTPTGKMTLAWHTNIAPRWLDPGQHDGSATPDNFINVLHDALIKNYKKELYNHLALAEHFEFPEDATSATFRLRPDLYFHDGSPVTPEDVKWSYENYRGAWAQVLHDRTDRITIPDKRTIRFDFKGAVSRFPQAVRHIQCMRCRLGRAGEVLREGRQGRVCRQADRRRALQARQSGAGHEARFRGVRRLLRAGPRQGIHHPERARRGDPRRDGRARRSRHRLWPQRRTGAAPSSAARR